MEVEKTNHFKMKQKAGKSDEDKKKRVVVVDNLLSQKQSFWPFKNDWGRRGRGGGTSCYPVELNYHPIA